MTVTAGEWSHGDSFSPSVTLSISFFTFEVELSFINVTYFIVGLKITCCAASSASSCTGSPPTLSL